MLLWESKLSPTTTTTTTSILRWLCRHAPPPYPLPSPPLPPHFGVCIATRLAYNSRRRRSGSGLDKKPREVFQAALTCRAPRSQSFFGTEPKPTALSLRKKSKGLKEEEEGQEGRGVGSMFPVSPANSTSGHLPSFKVCLN